MIRAIFFDIDGTLIRTGGAGVQAFEQTFACEFGIPRATEAISFAGRTDTSLVRECFLKHGIAPGPENFKRFFDRYLVLLERCLVESKGEPCPGVRECIAAVQALDRPPLLALLTGNIRLGAELKLRRYTLWHHFQSGAFADDAEDRNQIAVVARNRAASLLGAPLEGDEILVIGDTPLDIQCANAIGARMLAVGTGTYTCDQLRCHGPTWTVESLLGCRFEDYLAG